MRYWPSVPDYQSQRSLPAGPAHSAKNPSNCQRSNDRRIGAVLDRIAQGLFQRRSALLHRPCGLTGGIARLAIEILRRTRSLLELAFRLRLVIASHAAKTFF